MTIEISVQPKRTEAALKAQIKELNDGIKKQEIFLSSPDIPNEAKPAIQKQLDSLRTEVEVIQQELDEHREAGVKSARAELTKLIHARDLAFIACDAKYCYIRNLSATDEQVNLIEWYVDYKRLLMMLTKETSNHERFDSFDEKDLKNVFAKADRFYLAKTSSFNEPKWNKEDVFNILTVQRRYWAPLDRGTEYNPLFDDLIYSLGGGKQENIDHLEQWVAFKYLNPEKHKIIPGLNITGKPGGNGKGMFSLILTSIFNSINVSAISSKSFTGGFNKLLEGKVVAILDDERKEGFPQTELKKATGNTSQVIEPKGVDAYTVDSTANLIVLDNTGLVKLAGGGSAGEDRRWSIIDTELTLLEHLEKKYNLTADQSKELAEGMGKIFESRIECGKWVAAMIDKHKIRDKQVLMPLHGQDYNNRLDDQKDQFAEIFEHLLPIFLDQQVLPARVLTDVIESLVDKKPTPRTLDTKFKEFLSRSGIKDVKKTRDVYVNLNWKGEDARIRFRSNLYSLNAVVGSVFFDYSLVSNTCPTSKSSVKLSQDTVNLHDYADEGVLFEGSQKTVASVASVAPPSNDAGSQQRQQKISVAEMDPTVAVDPIITKTTEPKDALDILSKLKSKL
jgi:hypothetical protein